MANPNIIDLENRIKSLDRSIQDLTGCHLEDIQGHVGDALQDISDIMADMVEELSKVMDLLEETKGD